jgi:hypothetical protein
MTKIISGLSNPKFKEIPDNNKFKVKKLETSSNIIEKKIDKTIVKVVTEKPIRSINEKLKNMVVTRRNRRDERRTPYINHKIDQSFYNWML